MLDKPQTLYDIADRLRDQGPPAGWQELDAADANVHVPGRPDRPLVDRPSPRRGLSPAPGGFAPA